MIESSISMKHGFNVYTETLFEKDVLLLAVEMFEKLRRLSPEKTTTLNNENNDTIIYIRWKFFVYIP